MTASKAIRQRLPVDVSNIKGFPAGGCIQRVKDHIYVVKRSYTYDEKSGKYKEARVTLGQVVDEVFYTKGEYAKKFQRGRTERKEPLFKPFNAEVMSAEMIEKPSAEQINILAKQFNSGLAGVVPIYYHLALKSGLTDDLTAAFGSAETAKKLFSIAVYLIISTGGSAAYYRHFAAEHYLPWPQPLTKQELLLFYRDIGRNTDALNAFIKLRADRLKTKDGQQQAAQRQRKGYCSSRLELWEHKAGLEQSFGSIWQDFEPWMAQSTAELAAEGRLFVSFIAHCLLQQLRQELSGQQKFSPQDIHSGCSAVRYHRRPSSGEVFYLQPTAQQQELAAAAGCAGIYSAAPEY